MVGDFQHILYLVWCPLRDVIRDSDPFTNSFCDFTQINGFNAKVFKIKFHVHSSSYESFFQKKYAKSWY